MSKAVIVTGASRGIGSSVAEAFAAEGYNVLINYLNSKNEALKLADKINNGGFRAEVFCANVSDKSQVDEMVDYCVSVFGSADVLVNNAGRAQIKLFTDITGDDWDGIINTNLKGVFNCCQSVLRYMIKNKKGKIINISSIWGIAGASCEVHYSASKAGVIGLTKALAKELAPSGINVNCIAPGIIETDMLGDLCEDEKKELEESTPLGRLGRPFDIANCALFLADEKNSFITGQVISPNGGYVI